ncbi:subtilisin-like protease SBT4.14 [Diospyros lotus]|uniref:subtilisin-like protease SBT4.14 n=1 Tax=Diospyros lotus TaxID=55363 RepID=UPI0022590B4E|nr:subtilisin-like protease SBT4.14 [Diospyros lotus]
MSRERAVQYSLLAFSYILLVIFMGVLSVNGEEKQKKDFYIAFLRDQPVDEQSVLQSHIDVLSTLKGSHIEGKESLVYSYSKSFNAFAAKLYEEEANELSRMQEVLSVFRNRYHKLHTTKSWDFVGLPQTARRNLKVESSIIVGVFDTGITPESESFADKGFGPPPAKWKGTCGHFANFSGCNNKLIGARYFKLDGESDPRDILSPLDMVGHGTHTSSTVAGSLVEDASLFGLARGTARGAVPSARVAMYKVCWYGSGCADMDLLAGFDAAIHDGVDLISLSIGGLTGGYVKDSISVGAFHAMKNGIVTVASAGNDGTPGSVTNHAPWIFTVAASGIDRQFRSDVLLGNGKTVSGLGVNVFDSRQKLYPLVSGSGVAKTATSIDDARYCHEQAMDGRKVMGKLIFCELRAQEWGVDSVVKGMGGVGSIIKSDEYLDVAQIFMAPATILNSSIADTTVAKYINSTRSPSAVIYKSHEVKIPAPVVASFSSRGPNPGSRNVLKPDIAAPGVDILASYTPLKSLTGLKGDTLFSKFTLMSGTSMSCPHVSGAVAYVKSFHPTWSPAMIKSAIMTTAKPMSRRLNKEAEFGYGVGQLNPSKAVSPGLVYDMDVMSYVQFLCHEQYKGSDIAALVGSKSINCSALLPGASSDALNYPTMQLSLIRSDHQKPTTAIFRRTVTNVGPPRSTYNATIRAPKGVEITVKPMSLSFSRALEKRSFEVLVKAKPSAMVISSSKPPVLSGLLIWRSSGHLVVRSPIAVYYPTDDDRIIAGLAAIN